MKSFGDENIKTVKHVYEAVSCGDLQVAREALVRLEAFQDIPAWLETLGMAHPNAQRLAA